MEFEFELFISDQTGEKMVFISAGDGASGAEYPYETAEDIGKAIATYLSNYYSEAVKTAGWDMTDTELKRRKAICEAATEPKKF